MSEALPAMFPPGLAAAALKDANPLQTAEHKTEPASRSAPSC